MAGISTPGPSGERLFVTSWGNRTLGEGDDALVFSKWRVYINDVLVAELALGQHHDVGTVMELVYDALLGKKDRAE